MVPLKDRKGICFLDLGCGQGAATLFLAREGFSVVAIDGSHSAISKLQDRLELENLTAELVCCEAGKVPYPDAYFDAIVDVVCMAHNSNTRAIAQEMARVVKVQGKLFSVIPAADCWWLPYDDKGHVEMMDEAEVRATFKGFFEVKVGWLHYSPDVTRRNEILSHFIVQGLRS